jgi:hypothetical protein
MDRVRHHIDLGVDRIGAPDHDQIGLRHFTRVRTRKASGTGDVTGPGRIDADGGEEVGIFLDVAQPVDAVAHHKAHRAGIVIRPDRFRAVLAFGFQECLGDKIERVVPADRLEFARAFRAFAAQGLRQPVGMMDALGIAGDLRADDACCVGIVRRAAHAADHAIVEHFDFERTGRGAIMRASRRGDPHRVFGSANNLVHHSRSI